MSGCSVEWCAEAPEKRGLCERHYQQVRAHGATRPSRHSRDRSERIEASVFRRQDGCWQWTGTVDRKGYGRLKFGGANFAAHRFVFETIVGAIPEGLELDHLCRYRACVNPAHLEPVSHALNIARSGPATKESCVKGHPLSGSNLYQVSRPGGRRGRGCRTCRNAIQRARRARLAAHPEEDQ